MGNSVSDRKREEAKAWTERAEALRIVAGISNSPGGEEAAHLAMDWERRAAKLKAGADVLPSS